MKKVLLIRNYEGFTGGHLKVLHYMEHIRSSGFAMPRVLLTPNSIRDRSNIFLAYPDLVVDEPVPHELLFLGGQDWRTAAALGLLRADVPIVNLIQGTHHGNPDSPLRPWLRHFATRICVGEEIKRAITKTGEVNGPVHTIINGIEPLDDLRLPRSARTVDIFISGVKDPVLARSVCGLLANTGLAVEVQTEACGRSEFLGKLRSAKATVLLPFLQEGCHLPPLKAMALDVAVVCSDTPGVHDYCRPNETALLTDRSAESLTEAALRLLTDEDLSARLRSNGLAMAQYYTLERERAAFLPILAQALGI